MATEACLTLRSQRPPQEVIEDEVQDALMQLKEVLQVSSMERLHKAKQELVLMIERMNGMKQAMEDDVAMKGKLTEIDVRCIDLARGRIAESTTIARGEVIDAGEWDASVAPWGSSQVQWNRILQTFDDLDDGEGVISVDELDNMACEICVDLDREVIQHMVAAADRDDDGTINHEEYIRCMRQFVLFQAAKGCIRDAVRLRMEVDRVINEMGSREDAAQAVTIEALRQSVATVGGYISQLEDNLTLNEEELHRVQQGVTKLDQMIRDAQEPLRVAEQRQRYRNSRPATERWNDNPEERLDTEVDGLKNALYLLNDELEAMIVTQGRLSELKNELKRAIGGKRTLLDIDSTCFNIISNWNEFRMKYEVVPSHTPVRGSPHGIKSARAPKIRVHPDAERYVRMVQEGLPRGYVMKEMVKYGVPPSLLPPEIGTGNSKNFPELQPQKAGARVAVVKPNGWWVQRQEGKGMVIEPFKPPSQAAHLQ